MNKEEIIKPLHIIVDKINKIYNSDEFQTLLHTPIKHFVLGGFDETKLENNTLTVEIPKGYKTLDTRELSEGDRHWIEIDLMKEEDMCKIRQPHTGFDCKCNKVEELPEETEYPLVFLANNHLSILGKARMDINQIIRYLKARE